MNTRTSILAMLTCFILASCSKDVVTGSGTTIIEERNISGFSAVETAGSTDVFITQDSTFSVIVKAYDNLVPQLRTAVENWTLKIYYPDGTEVKNDNSEVYITMPSLNGLVIEGDANISVAGDWRDTGDLDLEISGSGNITLGDYANIATLTASLSGSGNVYALDGAIVSQNADITISGSSNVELRVEEDLYVKISGSGSVSYVGDATVETDIDGSGSVKKL